MLVGTMRCILFLLMLETIHTNQEALDLFKDRWQLDGDLQCINRTVEQLGEDTTPKPNEPSYKGFRTYCSFIQEGAHTVRISKWPDDLDLLGVVFVVGKPPYTPVYKEGQRIQLCQSFVDLEVDTKPSWIHSEDIREIEWNLNRHCFYTTKTEDSVQYKYVFKIFYHPPSGRNAAYFESKRVMFLIPNQQNYLITTRESDLNRLCTRCVAGGGYSEFSPFLGLNLTKILEDTLKNYVYGLRLFLYSEHF